MLKVSYLILLGISFLLTIILPQYHKGFVWLKWLLGVSFITDVGADIASRVYGLKIFALYHITVPIYFILMALFLRSHITERIIRQTIIVSLAIFLVISISLSVFFYKIDDYPGIQINLMGILLISINLYVLLTLSPIPNTPIFRHPMLWICTGMIFFFSSIFFLNGVYNKLIEHKNPARGTLHKILNNAPNCIMYGCFVVGVVCSYKIARNLKSI
jgi:hypothetical protein